MDEKNLKNELGIEESVPIPADYKIPYFVHQDDMNKLDLSHKRVEHWMFGFAIFIFVTLILTNAYWIWNESQYEDVTTTVTQESASEGGGDAIINGDNAGAVFYGEGETDNNH